MRLFCLTLLLLGCLCARGQALQTGRLLLPPARDSLQPLPAASPHFLPAYARRNPAGHASLCRLELQIENRLPLAFWVKAGDSGIRPQPWRSLDVQVKLLRF
jgi:hypothetical protein